MSDRDALVQKLDDMDKKLDRCVIGLYGEPDEPEKGMVVRVDRLEQSKHTIIRAFWVFFASVVALVSHAISSLWKTQ